MKRTITIIQIILYIVAFAVTLAMFCACKASQLCEPQRVIVEKYRDTTIYVDVPREVVTIITPPDTLSEVATSLAKSTAIVRGGKLYLHTIENKPTKLPAEVKVPETTITETITIEVPTPLSWWQTFFIGFGKFSLCLLVAFLVWRLIRWKFGKK